MEQAKIFEILKATGKTDHDIKKHIKDGVIIYDTNEVKANLEQYADEMERCCSGAFFGGSIPPLVFPKRDWHNKYFKLKEWFLWVQSIM